MAGDSEDLPRFLVQVALSAVMVVAGLWIAFGHYDADVQKAAFGWLGVVIGYWLS